MADSIREKIMKNRVARLEGITAANGYENTIMSVQRKLTAGQTLESVPMLFVIEGREEKIKEDEFYTYKRLEVEVGIIGRIDGTTDARSSDEYMNSLRSDVEERWMGDIRCTTSGTNYAISTFYLGSEPTDTVEGEPEEGTVMLFEINYRTLRGNPKSL